ncbi:MAG: chemotaxis protein CheR [Candidatus Cloacimonetes bacterium]|nr:chemotaxis protein CheR [Candidatus Cloacimonadota bacterium]
MFNTKEISDTTFRKFAKLIYEKSGIALGDNKKPLFQSRIAKLLRKRDIASYKEYFTILSEDKSGEEIISFIDAISTNVTHFFREQKHFDYLTTHWQPESEKVRIWSSACSTGEEPYSIAIHLMESHPEIKKLEILASDISTRALERAKKGVYLNRAVKDVSPALIKKYFNKGTGNANGYVRVKHEVMNTVSITQINLIEKLPELESFDLIFCRNVMIYFDNKTKTDIVNKFYHKIKSGGMLFIGLSETLNGLIHPFEYIAPATYRKSI